MLYFLISEALVAAAFALTGLFIAMRGPKTPMAVFAADRDDAVRGHDPPPMHALVVNAPAAAAVAAVRAQRRASGLFIVFLYVFPDGRFTSWTVRILSALVLCWTALWPFVPAANPYGLRHPWPFIAIASMFASAVVVQLYWFYRVRRRWNASRRSGSCTR